MTKMAYNGVQSFSFREIPSKAEALNSNVHQMESKALALGKARLKLKL